MERGSLTSGLVEGLEDISEEEQIKRLLEMSRTETAPWGTPPDHGIRWDNSPEERTQGDGEAEDKGYGVEALPWDVGGGGGGGDLEDWMSRPAEERLRMLSDEGATGGVDTGDTGGGDAAYLSEDEDDELRRALEQSKREMVLSEEERTNLVLQECKERRDPQQEGRSPHQERRDQVQEKRNHLQEGRNPHQETRDREDEELQAAIQLSLQSTYQTLPRLQAEGEKRVSSPQAVREKRVSGPQAVREKSVSGPPRSSPHISPLSLSPPVSVSLPRPIEHRPSTNSPVDSSPLNTPSPRHTFQVPLLPKLAPLRPRPPTVPSVSPCAKQSKVGPSTTPELARLSSVPPHTPDLASFPPMLSEEQQVEWAISMSERENGGESAISLSEREVRPGNEGSSGAAESCQVIPKGPRGQSQLMPGGSSSVQSQLRVGGSSSVQSQVNGPEHSLTNVLSEEEQLELAMRLSRCESGEVDGVPFQSSIRPLDPPGVSSHPHGTSFPLGISNPRGGPKHTPGTPRLVVVDGNNVGMAHGNHKLFSVRALVIVVEYFQRLGNEVTILLPRSRWNRAGQGDREVLDRLEGERVLVYTPSRRTEHRTWDTYDDRTIIRVAVEEQGVIVTNDNYRELIKESPDFKEQIEERLLPFTWFKDVFLPSDDPLGKNGPNISQFLRH